MRTKNDTEVIQWTHRGRTMYGLRTIPATLDLSHGLLLKWEDDSALDERICEFADGYPVTDKHAAALAFLNSLEIYETTERMGNA